MTVLFKHFYVEHYVNNYVDMVKEIGFPNIEDPHSRFSSVPPAVAYELKVKTWGKKLPNTHVGSRKMCTFATTNKTHRK